MIFRRIYCWLNGHAYARVTALTPFPPGYRTQRADYTVCLRCLARAGGELVFDPDAF